MATTSNDVVSQLTSDIGREAMVEGLREHVRRSLRKIAEEVLNPEVEKFVDAAVAGFEAELQAYVNTHNSSWSRGLDVIVNYKFKKKEN